MTGAPKTLRPSSRVPWLRRPSTADAFDDTDCDRLMVFVPAIMSVGLLFSFATIMRDVFRWSGGRARDRRTAIEAGFVAAAVLDEARAEPDDIGVLTRPSYLLSALVLVGGAAYISIGSTANFLRDGGPVRDIGWLLAISLGLSVLLGFLSAVSLAVFIAWPQPPPWTLGSLRTTPLSTTPGERAAGPPFVLTIATWVAAIGTAMIVLMVGTGRTVTLEIDRPISDWILELGGLDRLNVLDLFGVTSVTFVFVALIGFSGFRCRVMALLFPMVFVVCWVSTLLLLATIGRERPLGIDNDSFPSGHLVQAVLFAGLVPLAIWVLTGEHRFATFARAVLVAFVFATALDRIHRQEHWPLDVLAGGLLGLTGVLATHWVMYHRNWHQRCGSCPWSDHPTVVPWQRGLFTVSPLMNRRLTYTGAALAVAAAGVLVTASLFEGLPTDPEGSGFTTAISTPVQLSLAALVGAGGLAALRWKAPAALAIAFGATGLGVFASVQYPPALTIVLTATVMVPAVLIWIAWQTNETWGSIAALALATSSLLLGTAAGSLSVHHHFFGPTHPDSIATTSFGQADWLWLGGATDRSAVIVAAGFEPGTTAVILLGDPQRPSAELAAPVDTFGLARFELVGLDPATTYNYSVVAAQSDHPKRADASFTTHDTGPQDLRIALGSCARSGSNGAVYDAIVASQPDLFLALGDLHYGNLASLDPADHVAAYGRAVANPGPAALFSSTPTAYVWDDHDYGPNDADGSSPARDAASLAYRAAIPHHGVSPDPADPINQAFSVGDVRFVLIDTRSHRTPASMLGVTQREWLIEEILAWSPRSSLVVWVNPTPWIAADGVGSDNWSAYPSERAMISDALATAGVDNLLMVSGDAHMVAIDDGTNSGYGTDSDWGFPVLHAAALDRPGSVKGGPYSHGAIPGAGQFALLEVEHVDDGVSVRLSGHRWDGRELISLEILR